MRYTKRYRTVQLHNGIRCVSMRCVWKRSNLALRYFSRSFRTWHFLPLTPLLAPPSPSRKGCLINDQMVKVSNNRVPTPTPPLRSDLVIESFPAVSGPGVSLLSPPSWLPPPPPPHVQRTTLIRHQQAGREVRDPSLHAQDSHPLLPRIGEGGQRWAGVEVHRVLRLP